MVLIKKSEKNCLNTLFIAWLFKGVYVFLYIFDGGNRCKECGGSSLCPHSRRKKSARSARVARQGSTRVTAFFFLLTRLPSATPRCGTPLHTQKCFQYVFLLAHLWQLIRFVRAGIGLFCTLPPAVASTSLHMSAADRRGLSADATVKRRREASPPSASCYTALLP